MSMGKNDTIDCLSISLPGWIMYVWMMIKPRLRIYQYLHLNIYLFGWIEYELVAPLHSEHSINYLPTWVVKVWVGSFTTGIQDKLIA